MSSNLRISSEEQLDLMVKEYITSEMIMEQKFSAKTNRYLKEVSAKIDAS
jgi:hypothetical protein